MSTVTSSQKKEQKQKPTKKQQKEENLDKDLKELDNIKQEEEEEIENPLNFMENYLNDTTKKVKIIDAFSLYLFSLWVIQVVYRYTVGDFPKNAYLAGLYSTGGLMIITICLRMQINPKTRYIKNQYFSTTFWEYLFSVFVFFVAIFNFLG